MRDCAFRSRRSSGRSSRGFFRSDLLVERAPSKAEVALHRDVRRSRARSAFPLDGSERAPGRPARPHARRGPPAPASPGRGCARPDREAASRGRPGRARDPRGLFSLSRPVSRAGSLRHGRLPGDASRDAGPFDLGARSALGHGGLRHLPATSARHGMGDCAELNTGRRDSAFASPVGPVWPRQSLRCAHQRVGKPGLARPPSHRTSRGARARSLCSCFSPSRSRPSSRAAGPFSWRDGERFSASFASPHAAT